MLASVQLHAMARLLPIAELQKAVFALTMLGQPSIYPSDAYWSFGPAVVEQQHEVMAEIGMLIFRCLWTVK